MLHCPDLSNLESSPIIVSPEYDKVPASIVITPSCLSINTSIDVVADQGGNVFVHFTYRDPR